MGYCVTLPARHLGSQTELWKFANTRWQKPQRSSIAVCVKDPPRYNPPWIRPRAVRRQIAYLFPRVKIPVGFNLKPKVVFVCLQSTGPPSGPRDTPVSAARELCSPFCSVDFNIVKPKSFSSSRPLSAPLVRPLRSRSPTSPNEGSR